MKNPLKTIAVKLHNEAKLYKAIMADPRCPRKSKWLIAAALAYAVSPIDLIPDFIPVAGCLDDIVIVSVLISIALKKIPKEVVQEHREKLLSDTKDQLSI